MPAVGMRSVTRVFGARVLRSGRRLYTEPSIRGGKHAVRVGADGREEWIELLEGVGDGESQCKENGWHDDDDAGSKQEVAEDREMDIVEAQKGEDEPGDVAPCDELCSDSMWGKVYQRKRKRLNSKSDSSSEEKKRVPLPDRMYGKQFYRKRVRKIRAVPETGQMKIEIVDQDVSQGSLACQVLAAVDGSSRSNLSWFVCFLNSILRYMRRVHVSMPQLSTFLISEPMVRVYSSHGIHFLQDSTSVKSYGVCKIFGSRSFIPLFSVDFSAVPFCFMHLHLSLLLRCAALPNARPMYSKDIESGVEKLTGYEEKFSCIPCEEEHTSSIHFDGIVSGSQIIASGNVDSGKKRSVVAPRLASKTLQLRSGVTTRSIQKRRNFFRSRRGRSASAFSVRRDKALVTDLVFRHGGKPFSPVKSNPEVIRSIRRSSAKKMKELKSSIMEVTQDIDSTSCSASILVIESDKCYREKGAVITLEVSVSEEWFLAVNKDGIRRYSLTPQKVMRPCCCNRVTNAIIWTDDNGWKLEFPERREWLIFKELYRECSDRNAKAPRAPSEMIPVPGVHEVLGYTESNNVPFMRPDTYITWEDDEVARALTKRMSNYVLDADDELWLKRFNVESCAENEMDYHISVDSFESIIDAFEKGAFSSPDDYTDLSTAVDLCMGLESREVLEAVHRYWMKKRKQKRSALVRVFQCYQPRRTQLLPKAVLRKKRSFKRKGSKSGRGKQRTFLQAMAVERDTLEEQNDEHKVEEAKAAASRSEGAAVVKRNRAQLLMEAADLAAYRATMALRIAEAARVAESTEAAASFFLG